MTAAHRGDNPVLLAAVRDELISMLVSAQDIVRDGDDRAAMLVARREFPGLIDFALGMVRAHKFDADGRCVRCSSGPWWRKRAHRSMCKELLGLNIALRSRAAAPRG